MPLSNSISKNQKNKYLEMFSNFKNERTKKFTTIILTLIVISLFGLFAINPTISTIVKLKKELSDSESVHEQLQKKINNLSILQQQYSHIENDLSAILAAMPQKAEVPTLLSQIQSIAKESNIHLNNLENFEVELFKENKTPQKYYSYSFYFEGEGVYDNIGKFIDALVGMERVIDIDLLSITKTANKNESLRLNIQGVGYYKL